MIIQYFIDWDGIFGGAINLENIQRDLCHLTAQIKRNGCVVTTEYSRERMLVWMSKFESESRMGLALTVNQLCSPDTCLNVDEATESTSLSLDKAVESWKNYLHLAGLQVQTIKDDERCLFVSNSIERVKRGFYKRVTLDHALHENLPKVWSCFQHSAAGALSKFRKYLEAFSVALDVGKGEIRIYDPYLWNAFLPVGREFSEFKRYELKNHKAWRISLYELLNILVRNNFISKIDFITSLNDDDCQMNGFRLTEVADDLLKPHVQYREEKLEIAFHFLTRDKGRAFHDRFMSNGRYFYSIGHGFDVCEVDSSFDDQQGELDRRNVPRDRELTEFNIFYGGARWDCFAELNVFKDSRCNERGLASIYPVDYRARPFEEIKDRFDGSLEGGRIKINEKLDVSINPLTR